MMFDAALHPARIALAMVILKSKPVSQSIEEYIVQIQSVVRYRTRKHPVDSQQYIDGTLFWKRAYEKLETDKNKLNERIFDLEQTIKEKANIDSKPPPPAPAKRKAEDVFPTKANIQSKRRKPAPQHDHVEQTGDAEIVYQSLDPDCRRILQAYYRLRSAINDEILNVAALCQSIQTATRIARLFLQRNHQQIDGKREPLTQVTGSASSMKVVAKLWFSALDAIERIENMTSNEYTKCTPEMIWLFQTLLGRVQQHCLDEADEQIKSKKRQKSRKLSDTTINNDSGNNPRPWMKSCQDISATLCQMLSALTLESDAHCLLLEGMICAVLDHTGSSMSLLVFAEKGVNIGKQQGLLTPQGLLDVAHLGSDTAILTCQLAAPYLVLVFQRVITIVNNMNDVQRHKLLKTDPVTWNNSLQIKLKDKLQHTLLRGVYGDNDASFGDAFNRSAEALHIDFEKILASMEADKDRSEWFIGQIWEHLGWDMLTAD